jgi:hypothetical protein
VCAVELLAEKDWTPRGRTSVTSGRAQRYLKSEIAALWGREVMRAAASGVRQVFHPTSSDDPLLIARRDYWP